MEATKARHTVLYQAQTLLITRIFHAPRELVFEAWMQPRRMMRWWGPAGFTCPFCTIDLRPGGLYFTCMRSPDGHYFWSRGEYREIVKPRLIVCTDSFADEEGNVVSPQKYGMSPDWPEETIITVNLTEHDDQTRMILQHSPIKPGRDCDMCSQGWNESFDKLADYLEDAIWEE